MSPASLARTTSKKVSVPRYISLGKPRPKVDPLLVKAIEDIEDDIFVKHGIPDGNRDERTKLLLDQLGVELSPHVELIHETTVLFQMENLDEPTQLLIQNPVIYIDLLHDVLQDKTASVSKRAATKPAADKRLIEVAIKNATKDLKQEIKDIQDFLREQTDGTTRPEV
jgi:hypothetical protein